MKYNETKFEKTLNKQIKEALEKAKFPIEITDEESQKDILRESLYKTLKTYGMNDEYIDIIKTEYCEIDNIYEFFRAYQKQIRQKFKEYCSMRNNFNLFFLVDYNIIIDAAAELDIFIPEEDYD